MNKELDKCSMERDRYKMLVQQLQHKESSSVCLNNNYRLILTNDKSGKEILATTRDHNCVLELKVLTNYLSCMIIALQPYKKIMYL